MKSFIKFGNLYSKAIQRTIVFVGMLLVFFLVVYFVKKYSTMESMTDMVVHNKKNIENFTGTTNAECYLPMIYFNFDQSSLKNGIFKNMAIDDFDGSYGYDQTNPITTDKKNGDGCFNLHWKIINWGSTKFGKNGLTIAFWFKSKYASQGMMGKHFCIFGCTTRGAANNDPGAFAIYINANANTSNNSQNYEPGKIVVYYDNTGGDSWNSNYKYKFDSLSEKFTEDTWTHFALTVEKNSSTNSTANAKYTMYINGKQVNDMEGPYPTDPTTMSIGRLGDGGGWRAGQGSYMDDFSLYRRVLSKDEITKIMNESGMISEPITGGACGASVSTTQHVQTAT